MKNIFYTIKNNPDTQRGNAMVIILAVVAILALGGLGYLSTQMAKTADEVSVSDNETAANDNNAQNENTDVANTNETQAETPSGDIAEGNPVVAVVAGEEISRMEVLQFVQNLPAQTRQLPIEQLFPLARDQVINAKIIDMKTENVRLDRDPRVKEQMEEAKKQIVKSVYIEKEIEKRMSDDRIQAQYDEIVAKTPTDVQEVKAAHILVEDEETARQVIDELVETGDFAALAQEYSKDSTAQNGGSLGYFTKEDVVPEFGDATFNLKPGMYTKDPVKTQFGYHVIRVDDKRDRKPPSLEDAKPYIEANMRQTILNEILQEWQQDMEIKRMDVNGNQGEKTTMAQPPTDAPVQPQGNANGNAPADRDMQNEQNQPAVNNR